MATHLDNQHDETIINNNITTIRDCDEYMTCWKDCKSWRNVFHEYYVHGRQPSCDQWKEDYNNCILWKTDQSFPAKEALIQSEQLRLKTVNEDSPVVWKLRTTPCPDWPRNPSSGTRPRGDPS